MAVAQDGNKIFTVAHSAGFPDLDPATSSSNDGAIMANVYESLKRYIRGRGDAPATVVPLLAEKWDVSADGLTWTFHPAAGVKFHDGADLTATAVKSSIERTVKIAGGASFIEAPVTSIKTPDPATVVMKLSAPQPLDMIAASGFAAWIVSPTVLDKENTWFKAGNGSGTGPCKMERYEPGQRCILTRNKTYWAKAPFFNKAVFAVVEDPVLSQSMIQGGNADWTYVSHPGR